MTNGDRVEDAFSRFEMLERRVDEAEGRADALGLGYKKSLDEEIAELQAADKVADELAALKAAPGTKEGAGPMEGVRIENGRESGRGRGGQTAWVPGVAGT